LVNKDLLVEIDAFAVVITLASGIAWMRCARSIRRLATSGQKKALY